jgi:VWFA-related protein
MRTAAAVLAVAIGSLAAGSPDRDGQSPQFRSGVDVVELNVAVLSGRRVVADLTAADFEVTDNGVRQQVLSVTRELLPIDVTMVVDTSESVTESLIRSILSAVNRIRERLRPEDRVSLVTFNQRIQERVALLPPPAVRAIEIGRPTGQTSLNDAIAVVLAQRPATDRRQMAIVFTDGYDSTSILTEDDVMNLAGRSSTTVFAVSRAPIGALIQPESFFQRVTAATGGVAQTVPAYTIVSTADRTVMRRNDNILDDSFIKALEDFRSSYVVRYNLAGVPRPGWHAVVVKVIKSGRYQVRTRTGYMGG